MEIQEIKARLTLAEVLAHYRLKPDKHGRLHCPFHDDRTPPAGCRILYTLLFLTYFEDEIFYMPFAMASERPPYLSKQMDKILNTVLKFEAQS